MRRSFPTLPCTITGGGGTGATAVANMDASANPTRITMTAPRAISK